MHDVRNLVTPLGGLAHRIKGMVEDDFKEGGISAARSIQILEYLTTISEKVATLERNLAIVEKLGLHVLALR